MLRRASAFEVGEIGFEMPELGSHGRDVDEALDGRIGGAFVLCDLEEGCQRCPGAGQFAPDVRQRARGAGPEVDDVVLQRERERVGRPDEVARPDQASVRPGVGTRGVLVDGTSQGAGVVDGAAVERDRRRRTG